MFYCDLSLSHMMSQVRCGILMHQLLTFAFLSTQIKNYTGLSRHFKHMPFCWFGHKASQMVAGLEYFLDTVYLYDAQSNVFGLSQMVLTKSNKPTCLGAKIDSCFILQLYFKSTISYANQLKVFTGFSWWAIGS